MVSNISETDVVVVANSIKKKLTTEQVNKVILMYPHEEECDTTGTWNLIVENCIHQVLSDEKVVQ
jgi:hypothetical protein